MLIERERKTHRILWPFVAFWNFFAFLHDTEGQFIAAMWGMILLIGGIFLFATPVGIPLIIFGFFILVRIIFQRSPVK